MDIEKAITDGIVFKGGKSSGRKNEEESENESERRKVISPDFMARVRPK